MAEETNEQVSSGDEARARAAARFEHLQNELKAKRKFDIQVCVIALLVISLPHTTPHWYADYRRRWQLHVQSRGIAGDIFR